jgi:hypothetical protein
LCNTGLIPILWKWTVFLLLFIFLGLSESCVYLVSFCCGEAEVVIFVVDKYHCIPLDGRAAFGVQVNV